MKLSYISFFLFTILTQNIFAKTQKDSSSNIDTISESILETRWEEYEPTQKLLLSKNENSLNSPNWVLELDDASNDRQHSTSSPIFKKVDSKNNLSQKNYYDGILLHDSSTFLLECNNSTSTHDEPIRYAISGNYLIEGEFSKPIHGFKKNSWIFPELKGSWVDFLIVQKSGCDIFRENKKLSSIAFSRLERKAFSSNISKPNLEASWEYLKKQITLNLMRNYSNSNQTLSWINNAKDVYEWSLRYLTIRPNDSWNPPQEQLMPINLSDEIKKIEPSEMNFYSKNEDYYENIINNDIWWHSPKNIKFHADNEKRVKVYIKPIISNTNTSSTICITLNSEKICQPVIPSLRLFYSNNNLFWNKQESPVGSMGRESIWYILLPKGSHNLEIIGNAYVKATTNELPKMWLKRITTQVAPIIYSPSLEIFQKSSPKEDSANNSSKIKWEEVIPTKNSNTPLESQLLSFQSREDSLIDEEDSMWVDPDFVSSNKELHWIDESNKASFWIPDIGKTCKISFPNGKTFISNIKDSFNQFLYIDQTYKNVEENISPPIVSNCKSYLKVYGWNLENKPVNPVLISSFNIINSKETLYAKIKKVSEDNKYNNSNTLEPAITAQTLISTPIENNTSIDVLFNINEKKELRYKLHNNPIAKKEIIYTRDAKKWNKPAIFYLQSDPSESKQTDINLRIESKNETNIAVRFKQVATPVATDVEAKTDQNADKNTDMKELSSATISDKAVSFDKSTIKDILSKNPDYLDKLRYLSSNIANESNTNQSRAEFLIKRAMLLSEKGFDLWSIRDYQWAMILSSQLLDLSILKSYILQQTALFLDKDKTETWYPVDISWIDERNISSKELLKNISSTELKEEFKKEDDINTTNQIDPSKIPPKEILDRIIACKKNINPLCEKNILREWRYAIINGAQLNEQEKIQAYIDFITMASLEQQESSYFWPLKYFSTWNILRLSSFDNKTIKKERWKETEKSEEILMREFDNAFFPEKWNENEIITLSEKKEISLPAFSSPQLLSVRCRSNSQYPPIEPCVFSLLNENGIVVARKKITNLYGKAEAWEIPPQKRITYIKINQTNGAMAQIKMPPLWTEQLKLAPQYNFITVSKNPITTAVLAPTVLKIIANNVQNYQNALVNNKLNSKQQNNDNQKISIQITDVKNPSNKITHIISANGINTIKEIPISFNGVARISISASIPSNIIAFIRVPEKINAIPIVDKSIIESQFISDNIANSSINNLNTTDHNVLSSKENNSTFNTEIDPIVLQDLYKIRPVQKPPITLVAGLNTGIEGLGSSSGSNEDNIYKIPSANIHAGFASRPTPYPLWIDFKANLNYNSNKKALLSQFVAFDWIPIYSKWAFRISSSAGLLEGSIYDQKLVSGLVFLDLNLQKRINNIIKLSTNFRYLERGLLFGLYDQEKTDSYGNDSPALWSTYKYNHPRYFSIDLTSRYHILPWFMPESSIWAVSNATFAINKMPIDHAGGSISSHFLFPSTIISLSANLERRFHDFHRYLGYFNSWVDAKVDFTTWLDKNLGIQMTSNLSYYITNKEAIFQLGIKGYFSKDRAMLDLRPSNMLDRKFAQWKQDYEWKQGYQAKQNLLLKENSTSNNSIKTTEASYGVIK